MDIFIKLFQSDVGLFSALTLGLIVLIALYLFVWVKKQADKETKEQKNY